MERAFGGLVALGLLVSLRFSDGFERDRTHIGEEDPFVRARERADGLLQRQPFHSLDVIHQLASLPADRSHMPELDDLDLAINRIRHGTEKLVNRNFVSGLFHDLSPGGGNRALARIELPLGQDPGLLPAQSHDGDARPAAYP